MLRRVLFLALVLCAFWRPLTAQAGGAADPVRVDAWPEGSVAINQGWRTQAGDDPAFARRDFDDSGWRVVGLSDPSVNAVGPRWYRLHLVLPHGHPAMGLLVTTEENAFEVYVNGERVGDFRVGSPLRTIYASPHSVALPEGIDDLQLAVRRVEAPYSHAISGARTLFRAASIGPIAVTRLGATEHYSREVILFLSSGAIDVALCMAGIGVLGLFFAQRSNREYLWLSLLLFLLGLDDFLFAITHYALMPHSWNALFADPAGYVLLIPQIEFTFAFVNRRVGRLWRLYEVILMASFLVTPLSNWLGTSTSGYLWFEILVQAPASLGLPLALMIWYRRGNREAGWLILPSLLPGLMSALFNFAYIERVFLQSTRFDWLTALNDFSIGPVPFRTQAVTYLVFLMAIGVVLFVRYTKVTEAQTRSAAEMDAAREVQRKLVPVELPRIAGFTMQAAYMPAAEVGGDFYQVIPQADGGALLVVGDVSGKGLKAAMTGTLAIGALRAIAADEVGPAELLRRLNEQLVEADQGGFCTMICARLASDGLLTLANAGHLQPYWNGLEIELETGIPLGIAGDAAYAESSVQLMAGDSLTLMSDGVVEARKADGELFGFARTLALSTETPERIARAALEFGQEDDITVVGLTFGPSAAGVA